ncbi:MAG: cold shock domain-containing protein [Chitinophagales bacterium]|nr:cold shock domain-containing protein [Chitinophagales bacterium]MCZ2394697.1 cold shock domain-containing protein [Chitinophagales bacterium]
MADNYNKKALEQKKAKKKQDKLMRKEERKANNNKGKSLDELLVYVDEYGNVTDVPPEKQNRIEINLEDIQLGAAPIVVEEIKEFTGIVSSFLTDKAYGFITEDNSRESVFVHSNQMLDEIKENDRVTYHKERTPKGYSAINVRKIN